MTEAMSEFEVQALELLELIEAHQAETLSVLGEIEGLSLFVAVAFFCWLIYKAVRVFI